jgi:hypothetical protein
MQIESCYGRLLRLRPKLRHLNATCGPTPSSRRGKCEFNVRHRRMRRMRRMPSCRDAHIPMDTF